MNPYVVKHTPLKRACLPVPAFSHMKRPITTKRRHYYSTGKAPCQQLFVTFSGVFPVSVRAQAASASRYSPSVIVALTTSRRRLEDSLRGSPNEIKKRSLRAWLPADPDSPSSNRRALVRKGGTALQASPSIVAPARRSAVSRICPSIPSTPSSPSFDGADFRLSFPRISGI